jgi:hypothetical protein
VGNALCSGEGPAGVQEAFSTFPWAVFSSFPVISQFMEYWKGSLVRRRWNQGMEGMDPYSAQEHTQNV